VRLLVRIHRENGSTSFRDDMGARPITAGRWTTYQIDAPIASDARDIEFGMQLIGEGSAFIDNISIVFGRAPSQSDDRDIRALIKKFAHLRNAHDGPGVAALYSENGEWFHSDVKNAARGRQALAMLWGRLPGTVERTIESIDFLGGDVAMIRVTTQYAEPIGRHHESFVVVKENGLWYIHAHQSVD
jgi:ketosteroid isomerase-like protein